MTLPPVHQPLSPPSGQNPALTPVPHRTGTFVQGRLTSIDLEILAEKLVDMIKRELQLDNEREGRQS
jgi:hypothetical protein